MNIENQIIPLERYNGKDLSGWSFARSDLHCSIFTNCNLTGASFNGADLRFSQFIKCDLTRASFIGACLLGAVSKECNSKDADWSHCDMDSEFIIGLINFTPGQLTTLWEMTALNETTSKRTTN